MEGGKEKQLRFPDCLTVEAEEGRADFPRNTITGQLRYKCFSIINEFSGSSVLQVFKSTCTHKVPLIRIVLLQLVLNRTVADVWRTDQETLAVN